jgi:hypothetical protein
MMKPFTFVIGLLTVVAPAFSAEVFIFNFAKSNNMQVALQLAYPSGLFTPDDDDRLSAAARHC